MLVDELLIKQNRWLLKINNQLKDNIRPIDFSLQNSFRKERETVTRCDTLAITVSTMQWEFHSSHLNFVQHLWKERKWKMTTRISLFHVSSKSTLLHSSFSDSFPRWKPNKIKETNTISNIDIFHTLNVYLHWIS